MTHNHNPPPRKKRKRTCTDDADFIDVMLQVQAQQVVVPTESG